MDVKRDAGASIPFFPRAAGGETPLTGTTTLRWSAMTHG